MQGVQQVAHPTELWVLNFVCGRLAQLAEQLTLNQRVTGSNPVSPIRNGIFGVFIGGRSSTVVFDVHSFTLRIKKMSDKAIIGPGLR